MLLFDKNSSFFAVFCLFVCLLFVCLLLLLLLFLLIFIIRHFDIKCNVLESAMNQTCLCRPYQQITHIPSPSSAHLNLRQYCQKHDIAVLAEYLLIRPYFHIPLCCIFGSSASCSDSHPQPVSADRCFLPFLKKPLKKKKKKTPKKVT